MATLEDRFTALDPAALYVIAYQADMPGEVSIFPVGVFSTEEEAIKLISTIEIAGTTAEIRQDAADRLMPMRMDVLFSKYRHFHQDKLLTAIPL